MKAIERLSILLQEDTVTTRKGDNSLIVILRTDIDKYGQEYWEITVRDTVKNKELSKEVFYEKPKAIDRFKEICREF